MASRSRSGGEDLQGDPRGARQLDRLGEDHGERVRLLARRAAGHPGAHDARAPTRLQQVRQHVLAQVLPCLGIAEEARDADRRLLEQELDLAGVFPEVAHVVRQLVDLVQAHPPLDASVDGAHLVEREVVAGVRPEQDEDLLEGAQLLVLEDDLRRPYVGRVLFVGDDAGGQLVGGRDHVREPRLDGALGHARELRGRQRLDEGGPRLLLDGAQAERAVRAHAREHDADAALLPVLGQRTEEEVDRQVETARRRLRQEVQHAVEDRDVLARRDDVDAVGLHRLAIRDLRDGHRGRALEQLHHRALVRGVEVLDDDVGHPAARRHVPEELLERLEAPGRRADADDGEAPRAAPGLLATRRSDRRSFRGSRARRRALRFARLFGRSPFSQEIVR